MRALAAVGRALLWLFMKVEEPRVLRVAQFSLYLTLTFLGGVFLSDPPRSYEGVLGVVLAWVFGVSITAGGLFGALAVLPGWWWLERLGIISLWTGLGMYIVVAASLQASSVGLGVAVALAIAMLIRWLTVREYQVAPGR
jgi:hypothetical protein